MDFNMMSTSNATSADIYFVLDIDDTVQAHHIDDAIFEKCETGKVKLKKCEVGEELIFDYPAMFKALHLTPQIKGNDIEIAKKKLKHILGLSEAENNFDDIDSDIDDEGHHPDGEEFYVVEKVLDRSLVNGVPKFKVKWEGHETITWEPLDNFVSRGSKMAIFLYYVRRWEKKLEKKEAANQAEIGRASDIGKEKKESQSKSCSSLVASDEARNESNKADGNPGSSKVSALKTKSEQESKSEVQAVRSIFGQTPADGRCKSSFNRTSTNYLLKTIKEEQKMEIERRRKREALEKQMKDERLRRKEEKDRERRMKQLTREKDLGSSSDED